MLLGHRDLATLPALAYLAHHRQHDPVGDGGDRQSRERIVQDRIRVRLVEVLERRP